MIKVYYKFDFTYQFFPKDWIEHIVFKNKSLIESFIVWVLEKYCWKFTNITQICSSKLCLRGSAMLHWPKSWSNQNKHITHFKILHWALKVCKQNISKFMCSFVCFFVWMDTFMERRKVLSCHKGFCLMSGDNVYSEGPL